MLNRVQPANSDEDTSPVDAQINMLKRAFKTG